MTLAVPNAPLESRNEGALAELEFGKLTSEDYLHESKHPPGKPITEVRMDEPPYYIYIMTYISYLILIIFGHVRDFFGKIFRPGDYNDLIEKDGYAPWYDGFESFYIRRLKDRIDDLFARPIHGAPGRYTRCFDRIRLRRLNYHYTGNLSECLNLSSYNYLGFGQSKGACTDCALDWTDKYGTANGTPLLYSGANDYIAACEKRTAEFVGQESALVVSQGYGTNGSLFASLLDENSLIISDELNHASIRYGIRLSGASVKVCKHNDAENLEEILRISIAQGQPRSHRPWKKIIIAIEGLYSMEGNMCNLPKIVELKERYKCYLFVDEAHSIGALGPRGRGVCDYFSIDPTRVDILMGTFTKSFGATGGYISGKKALIDRLRINYMVNAYSELVSPAVAAQIITSMSIIEGKINPGEGVERLRRITFNSRYLRLGLKRLGFIVYGADDSPVIPLLLYLPSLMPVASRMLYEDKIIVVVVGYPATPLSSARLRLCVSSALTKEDIDYVLTKFSEIGDKVLFKFGPGALGSSNFPLVRHPWSLEEVLSRTPGDCKKSSLN